MVKKLVTSALFAGFAAGLIAAALQIALLVPLILEAELYETGALVHFADTTTAMLDIQWEYDWVRNGITVLATVAVYIGYAFILVAAMAFAQLKGIGITARSGILWGLAGAAVFNFAPALGLPPELPGMIAAELAPRQVWWAGTVAATIAGLSAIAFGKSWLPWGIGIAVVAIPHLIGAPIPEVFGGSVPPELAAEFAGRSITVGAIGWVGLGVLSAYFWLKENA
ncbi:MAG: CbtA family protein [Rhodobacteraceae bacterium]|nr:CbtA family protein [Paracoccaceae bacterium]